MFQVTAHDFNDNMVALVRNLRTRTAAAKEADRPVRPRRRQPRRRHGTAGQPLREREVPLMTRLACVFCLRPGQWFSIDYRGETPPSWLAVTSRSVLCLDCADALSRSNGPRPKDDPA